MKVAFLPSRSVRHKIYGAGLLGVVLVLGGWFSKGEALRPERDSAAAGSVQPPKVEAPGRVATGCPRRGATVPLVTVVEYSEFECPTCQGVAKVLADLVLRHPQDLAVIWKDRPTTVLRPRSPIAAKFARGIYESRGNEAFWKVHDRLFVDLSQLRDADLVRLGSEFGFDTRRLLSAPADSIEKSIAAAGAEAQSLGIFATPTIVVNGHLMKNSDGDVGAVVEKELEKARALERQGLTRDEVGARLKGPVLSKTEET